MDPKIIAQVEKGIKRAVRKLEHENELTQANIVKDVYASDKFLQVRQNFRETVEKRRIESEQMCQEALDELDDLVKYIKMSRKEYKKEAQHRR